MNVKAQYSMTFDDAETKMEMEMKMKMEMKMEMEEVVSEWEVLEAAQCPKLNNIRGYY